MPTKSEINEKFLKELLGMIDDAETKVLSIIAKKAKNQIGWPEYKAKELLELRQEVESILKNNIKGLNKKIANEIVTAYKTGIINATKEFGIKETAMLDIIPYHIQHLILETNNVVTNTLFPVLRSTNDIYRKVISELEKNYFMGVETQQEAVQKVLNQFAAIGVTGFVDKLGRKWDLFSYVDMAIRTSIGNAALQGHIDRLIDLNHDLVIVSSHNASCPICRPWAGKVLSLTGKTPNYPTLQEAKMAGLFHPNCKHTISAYFCQFDHEKQEIPENDNELYEATQKQRYYERQIRKWKRIESVAITDKAKVKAQAKIKYWQKVLNEHVKEYNLKRLRYREQIKVKNINKPNITEAEKEQLRSNLQTIPKFTLESISIDVDNIKPLPNKLSNARGNSRSSGKASKTNIVDIDFNKLFETEFKDISSNSSPENRNIYYSYVNKHGKHIESKEIYKNAVIEYTRSSININEYMRDKERFIRAYGEKNDVIKQAKDLHKAIKTAPKIDENIKVYRWVELRVLEFLNSNEIYTMAMDSLTKPEKSKELIKLLNDKLKFATLKDEGFFSTSVDTDIFKDAYKVRFEIAYPKDSKVKALFVESHSVFKGEEEVLFDAGTEWTILNVEILTYDSRSGSLPYLNIKLIPKDYAKKLLKQAIK